MTKATSTLDHLFRPQSVAVVGASTRSGSVGRALVANLLRAEYAGVVHAVNPRAQNVLGIDTVPSVMDLPGEVDLALVCVPAGQVPSVLHECGNRAIPFAAVISSGFRETGEEGETLEEQLRDSARRGGVSLLGPNCLGVINASADVRLNATFGHVSPNPGCISLISQSGAVGTAALDYMKTRRIGVAKFVSIGNKAGLNENDVLRYLREDDDTRVVLLYLEDLADPRGFMAIARAMAGDAGRPKPVLAVKGGRTSAGARAARSHTGALVSGDDIVDAFFSQSRVLRMSSLREMLDGAVVLATQPPPRGRRVAVVTNAGGIGTVASDAIESCGLSLADVSSSSRRALSSLLSPGSRVGNPVDLMGDADPDRFASVVKEVGRDDGNDAVLAVWAPTLMSSSVDLARTLAASASRNGKPVIPCFPAVDDAGGAHEALVGAGLPLFRFPEEAVKALSLLCRAGELAARPEGRVLHFPDVRLDRVRQLIELARSREPVFLSEAESLEILEACGFPVLPYRLARNRREACRAAGDLGYPVTIKLVSPDVVHKLDVGGVRGGIEDEEALLKAYMDMFVAVRRSKPYADVRGVLVQAQAPDGLEVMLGMKRDEHFGSIIAFGQGGSLVPVLADLRYRLSPMNTFSLESIVRETAAGILLDGYRGEPPGDADAVKELLARLSQMAVELEDVAEIDVNPLVVRREGRGAVVVGARVVLG